MLVPGSTTGRTNRGDLSVIRKIFPSMLPPTKTHRLLGFIALRPVLLRRVLRHPQLTRQRLYLSTGRRERLDGLLQGEWQWCAALCHIKPLLGIAAPCSAEAFPGSASQFALNSQSAAGGFVDGPTLMSHHTALATRNRCRRVSSSREDFAGSCFGRPRRCIAIAGSTSSVLGTFR